MSEHRERKEAAARLGAFLDDLDGKTRRPGEKSLRRAVAEQAQARLREMTTPAPDGHARDVPCPTCSGPVRETVGMVCQTCGTDYGQPTPAPPADDTEDGRDA